MRFFKIKHINFNLVTTPAKPWSYQFMLVPSRYGEVSIKFGNEPERRVIMRALVPNPARPVRHHIYSGNEGISLSYQEKKKTKKET